MVLHKNKQNQFTYYPIVNSRYPAFSTLVLDKNRKQGILDRLIEKKKLITTLKIIFPPMSGLHIEGRSTSILNQQEQTDRYEQELFICGRENV